MINSYNVTLNVINGYATSQNPIIVNYGGSVSFTIAANSGYKLNGASVSCAGGNYNQAGYLTVSGVTENRVCTITLIPTRITFEMRSANWCGDPIYDSSSPCYLIFVNSSVATYNGRNYTNCVINWYNLYKQPNKDIYPATKITGGVYWGKVSDIGYFWRVSGSAYVGACCEASLTCDN